MGWWVVRWCVDVFGNWLFFISLQASELILSHAPFMRGEFILRWLHKKNNSAQVVEISKAKWTSILFLKVVFHFATFTYTIYSEQHSFGRWIAVSFAANCTPFCVSCALTQHQMGQSSVRYKIAFCIKANHNDNYFLWLVGDWGIRRGLFMLKCLLKRIQKRTKNKFTTSVLPN